MTDQIFLVRGNVTRSNYMNDDGPTVTETRLVYAIDENEAHNKFVAFWKDQSSDYSHGYRVDSVDVLEPIR